LPLRGQPVGYGVIGSPADSDSVSLGSSPSIPAKKRIRFFFIGFVDNLWITSLPTCYLKDLNQFDFDPEIRYNGT
jgi:hypothetical protein